MAEIRPFRGICPAPEYAARVAALPYDVYSRQEARLEAAWDRLSFLNIDRPETQFAADADMYAPEVYEKADAMLQDWLRQGILVQDGAPCYYLYELTMDGRAQTGLVACASIDDYTGGVIRRHENTRAEKEADRVRHVDACSAQTGPIFLAYRRSEAMQEVTRRAKMTAPQFDFTAADGIRHRGWRISAEADLAAIHAAFREIGRIYIADGHHRAASAVRVGLQRREQHPGWDGNEEFNYFLSILFPDDELRIMDYNRVVKDLNGLSAAEFLQRVKERFDVEPCAAQDARDDAGCLAVPQGVKDGAESLRDASQDAGNGVECLSDASQDTRDDTESLRDASQDAGNDVGCLSDVSQDAKGDTESLRDASQNTGSDTGCLNDMPQDTKDDTESLRDASQNTGNDAGCLSGMQQGACDARRPRHKGEITMYLDDRWYRLTIPEERRSADPVEGLDVSVLQRELLEPVLGIHDPRQDARIDFIGGIRGLEELERRVHSDCAVAFAMYPTSIGELFAVADAGRLMPPKSTWFEPKLRSGLFIHAIER